MTPDIRRILLLAEVARQGSMTAAAEGLNYTTSAISQQISRLEREVGRPVLRRDRRGVWLTDVGEILVSHARRMLTELEAIDCELSELERLRSATLHIGAFPTAASAILPAVMLKFRQQHKDVHVDVRSGTVAELQALLQHRQLELAVLCEYDCRRVPESLLSVTHLLDDPSRLALPAGHRLADRQEVDLGSLRHERWIIRQHHPMGELLVRACRAAGFEPNVAHPATDFHEVQAMVAMGLGVSLLPSCATDARPDVRIVDVRGGLEGRRVILASLRASRLSPPAAALERLLVETYCGGARPLAATVQRFVA